MVTFAARGFGALLMAWLLVGNSPALAEAQSGWATDVEDGIRTLSLSLTPAQGSPLSVRFTSDPTNEPGIRGVLAMEIELMDAGAHDFPFADFDGPDASAHASTPMTIAVSRADGSEQRWTLAPNGWTPEPPRFVFGVAAPNDEADSVPRQVFAAIAEGARGLEIRISAPDDPTRTITIAVPVDDQAATFAGLLAHVADVPLKPPSKE